MLMCKSQAWKKTLPAELRATALLWQRMLEEFGLDQTFSTDSFLRILGYPTERPTGRFYSAQPSRAQPQLTAGILLVV